MNNICCQRFAVRWMFLFVCVMLTSSLVWIVNRTSTTSARAKTNSVVDKVDGARQVLPNEILSTRTLMIEKQLGKPLVIDPNMPYIGYLKPEEWRKYDLPEGIGIGRGSRGKQRNKYGLKQALKPRKKSKKKPSGKKRVDKNFDPNQLFFDAALDEGVKANVVAVENNGPIVMSQKDGNDYQMQDAVSDEQDGASSVGVGGGLDYHGD